MHEYKPNSHKAKAEQNQAVEKKPMERVVKGEVKVKKKLSNVIFAEDAKSVGSYILMDVLLPTTKKLIVDMISEGANKIFLGASARRKGSSISSRVSYRDYYDSGSKPIADNKTRTGYSYCDIEIEDRAEAEEVLQRMDETIETYGVVTVADLYDLVGYTCEHTDNNYGWTNLRNAKVVRLIGGGYKLDLPKALPIKK